MTIVKNKNLFGQGIVWALAFFITVLGLVNFAKAATCHDVHSTCTSAQVCYQGACTTTADLGIDPPKNGGTCGTSSNDMVKQIQGIVGMSGNDVDGICGGDTITAIQMWQKNHPPLTPDGLLTTDGQTFKAMGLQTAATTATDDTAGKSTPSPCPTGLVMNPGGACLPPVSQSATGLVASKTLPELVLKVIQLLLGFAGAIAVLMIVVGGFWYLTSAGNEEQNEKGKKALFGAFIGLAAVILSFTIVTIISSVLNNDRR